MLYILFWSRRHQTHPETEGRFPRSDDFSVEIQPLANERKIMLTWVKSDCIRFGRGCLLGLTFNKSDESYARRVKKDAPPFPLLSVHVTGQSPVHHGSG